MHQEQRNQLSQQEGQEFKDLIGNSAQMRSVVSTIKKVAPTQADVLITGENGTGKELVARAIHKMSARSNQVFIAVDMGAINHQLFDSELLGHVKGAFTGASANRVGKVQAAHGGTLFLDEIGNLTPNMQVKMLKVLETRQACPLGSNKLEEVDIRLVCATNANLYEAVEEGSFRTDLLYRINTIEIHLPPLRQRRDDIPLLSQYFLQQYAQKYGKNIPQISDTALKRLIEYEFPGNVRELRHLIHRAVILCGKNTLGPDDLSLKPKTRAGALKLSSLNLEEAEEKLIAQALQKFNGNVSKAAKALGLNRTSLYRRMEKYGL